MNKGSAGGGSKNILLIRLKSIGDVVMTLPAVNAMREHFPTAKISFLTSRENAPLLRGFREVDEIISIDRARLGGGNPLKTIGEGLRLLRRLRAGNFSLVADFQGYGETEWLAWWTGAERRGGIVYKAGRGWLHTDAHERRYGLHPVEWNLGLLRSLGLSPGPIRNDFILPTEALAEARQFFADHLLNPGQPTIFLQPFTSHAPKNWPLEKFLDVARQWHARGAQIIFGGGPAEKAALEPARRAGFAVAAGVPLLVAGGVMRLSTIVMGADTGLLHLAVAVGCRVVMLIHASYPGTCHPLQHVDWAITPPPGKEVAEIETSRVMAVIAQALAERAPAK